MSHFIRFDRSMNRYELIVNGKVVCRGKKEYAEWKAKKLGLDAVETAEGEAKTVAAQVKSEFSVSERFEFISTFVNMIAKKQLNSLIITGDGGLGKTWTVIESLKALGKKEQTYGIDGEDAYGKGDFVVIKGFSTAKGLFRSLWENNGKIIVFDDADSVHKDPIGANILKGALDSGEHRVISWNAEFSSNEEMPNRFEFYGRVIFISNLTLSKFPQPLLSRSMKVDLTLNTEEKLDRIEHVFGEIKLDSASKKEVMSFLRKYVDKITDLNVRSAMNVLKLQQTIDNNWERIALYSVTA